MSDSPPQERPAGRLISKKTKPPSPGQAPDDRSEAPTLVGDPAAAGDAPCMMGPMGPGEEDTPSLAGTGEGFWDQLEQVPERIGPYQIQREVARGGMGIVLEAYHPQLDRKVAIKVLRAEVEASPRAEHRFLREARAAAKLRHPGIVAVHDVGIDGDGRSYLVMDMVVGESLQDMLGRGALPGQQAAELLEKIARAVAHAHDQGILHRDLKPHNVLIDAGDGAPLLTDFGLAKNVRLDDDASSVALRRARSAAALGTSSDETQVLDLTQTDDILGTPRYMSPEQIDPRIGELTVQSDVYSLGVVLYQCLTGRTPFSADTLEELFLRVLEDSPRPPSVYARDLSPQLEAIALRCLEKEPRLRYRTALELANDLARFRRAAPVLSVTHRTSPSRKSPWPSLLLAVALIALAVVVAQRRSESPEAAPSVAAVTPGSAGDDGAEPASGELLDDDLGDDLGLAGPRLSPQALTTLNVRRYAEEGFADAMHSVGYAILSEQIEGELPEALEWLEQASDAGYTRSTFFLGKLHRHGLHGVRRDLELALRWFRRGAEQGSLESTLGVAAILVDDPAGWSEVIERLEGARGSGDARVPELLGLALFKSERHGEAVASWREAAELGSTRAMRYLAQVYEAGQGVPRDYEEAMDWLSAAAEAGDAKAMIQLGLVYELGTSGRPQDVEQAKSWYRQALEAGSQEARVRLDALQRGG